ncbi:MAG: hypothetical protein U0Y82_09775 [Thermoleophilia bacterium]
MPRTPNRRHIWWCALGALWPLAAPAVLGAPVRTVHLAPAAIDGAWVNPAGVAVDTSGDVYVADPGADRVVEVTPDGAMHPVGTGLSAPAAVAVDADGTLYVADRGDARVVRIGVDGAMGDIGSGWVTPMGVAVDPEGDVYVADASRTAIARVAPDGTVTDVGGGLAAPTGVAWAPGGTLYVADHGHDRVVRIDPDGTVTALSGGWSHARGVAVGGDGTLYVADTGNNRVTSLDPAGVTNVVGTGWDAPTALATGPNGDVVAVRPYTPAVLRSEIRRSPTVTDPGDVAVNAGADVTLRVSATGIPAPAVHWQRSTDRGVSFTDVPGADGPQLHLTAVDTAMSGTRYRAVAVNGVDPLAISAAAALTVTRPAMSPRSAPQGGSPGAVTIVPSGPPAAVLRTNRMLVRWTVAHPEAVTGFEVRVTVTPPGGAARVTTVSTTRRRAPVTVTPGARVCVTVTAAGTDGSRVASPPRCGTSPLDTGLLTAGPGWTRVAVPGGYVGHGLRTTTRGATLSAPDLPAREVTLLASRGPGMGVVSVWSGRRRLGRFSLRARRTTHGVRIPVGRFGTPPLGPLRIRVESGGAPVVVEGLGLSPD